MIVEESITDPLHQEFRIRSSGYIFESRIYKNAVLLCATSSQVHHIN